MHRDRVGAKGQDSLLLPFRPNLPQVRGRHDPPDRPLMLHPLNTQLS
jgi:hypothetical protein